MKTSNPTLNIVQLTQSNKEGLYPIVLRAHWQGEIVEKRTGVSVTKDAWNKQSRCIRPSYPSSSTLNHIITSLYNQALRRKMEIEQYDPINIRLIFSEAPNIPERKEKKNPLLYSELLNGLISERALAYSSMLKLRYSFNTLCSFMGTKVFSINELTIDRLSAYGRWMKTELHLKNGSIKDHLYDVSNVWTYAITHRLIDPTTNPFITFHPKLIYPQAPEKKAVTEEQFDDIRDKLQDLILLRLKEKRMDVFSNIYSDEFTLAMYVLGYYFGGLALVDMSNLRKNQLSTMQQGKAVYYIFKDVQRQKTNRHVPLIVRRDLLTRPLIEYFMENSTTEYLFPIRTGETNPASIHKRMNTIARTINDRLRKITGLDITYYSCRHTFCTVAINKPGVTLPTVAAMMGRSPAGIFRYVKELTNVDDIIKARGVIGL